MSRTSGTAQVSVVAAVRAGAGIRNEPSAATIVTLRALIMVELVIGLRFEGTPR
jgi:hypothetical protein